MISSYFYFFIPVFLLGNIFLISRLIPGCRDVLSAIVVHGCISLIFYLCATLSVEFFEILFLIYYYLTIFFVVSNFYKFVAFFNKNKYYIAISWGYIFLTLFMYGDLNKNLGHQIAISLWPSVDNNISSIISKLYFDFGIDFIHKKILGDIIPITDRVSPSLGLLIPVKLISNDDNFSTMLGISLQTLWVIPANKILIKYSDRNVWRIVALCSIPVLFFYSIYTWWKIYSATFVLIAIIFLFEKKVLNALAILLGVITHGSHFYILPLFIRCKFKMGRYWQLSIFLFFAIALFFYVVPPSGQLIRWHIFGEPDNFKSSVVELVNSKILNKNVFLYKIHNFKNSIYPENIVDYVISTRAGHSGLFFRYIQQYSFLFSMAWLLLFVSWKNLKIKCDYVYFVFFSFLLTNFLEYGGPMSEAILHHRPFVETLLASIILLVHIKKIFLIPIVILNLCNFIFIWKPLANVDEVEMQLQYQYIYIGGVSVALFYFIFSGKFMRTFNYLNARLFVFFGTKK